MASTRIGTLVISNPAVAEQIFLFGAGTVIEIVAAGGIKEYLNQISTPEGAANKLNRRPLVVWRIFSRSEDDVTPQRVGGGTYRARRGSCFVAGVEANVRYFQNGIA